MNNNIKTIDEYIFQFSPEVQIRLNELRNFIKAEVPDATEKISYNMPTFYLNGNLVHFAAFKNHYGFFPTASGINQFKKELSKYITGKGTLHFALDEPFPFEILKKVIQFRVAENKQKTQNKKSKK
jgi:uncharacterized protein YdhG (YjbR/CyaY superfamily)